MDPMTKRTELEHPRQPRTAYEPPRVELVLTPDDLKREAHYAGVIS